MKSLKFRTLHRGLAPVLALCVWVAPLAALIVVPDQVHAQGPSSYIVVDGHNGKVFMEGNAGQRRPLGGFASVVTAQLTLDWAQRTGTELSARVMVPGEAVMSVASNPMGLMAGDVLTMRDLVYSMILARDDAAAATLAYHVGRSLIAHRRLEIHPVMEFIREMNAFGSMISLRNTTFTSPHGGQWREARQGTTTPADLARISAHVMKSPALRFYSVQPERTIKVERNGQALEFRVRNQNRWLGQGEVDGLKVDIGGGSPPALILTAQRPATVLQQPDGTSVVYPHRIIVFVEGGVDPFATAGSLMQSGWNEYDRWLRGGRTMDDGRPTLNSSRY